MVKSKREKASGALAISATHLLHRGLQLAQDFHAEAAGPKGLTQRQYTLLSAASLSEGQTQSQLVRATGIDRSTLAELVSRMLAKGLLERERSATDARANAVRLSASGVAALGEASGPAASADARLLSLLSPKKRESLMKLLGALVAAAEGPPKVKPEKTAKATKKKKKKLRKAPDDGQG
jgi:DNA-binding MarR family transcriptional regulator